LTKKTKGKQKKILLKSKSFETFPKIIEYIKKGSKLTIKDIEQLETLFGARVKKALELVGANRVKKYIFQPSGIVRWVVNGHQDDYLIIEHSFCSCKDFLFHALMKQTTPSCYHLLAREIAERTEKYTIEEVDDSTYQSFLDNLI
jgi:predicted nucleic acid-binding Zn finger protein